LLLELANGSGQSVVAFSGDRCTSFSNLAHVIGCAQFVSSTENAFGCVESHLEPRELLPGDRLRSEGNIVDQQFGPLPHPTELIPLKKCSDRVVITVSKITKKPCTSGSDYRFR
tara:strand:+ start:156 stop:497 length:342 start_codon:yes stop_codon:yes gene_type:complete